MATKTVHFSFGQNFPVLIGNIGQEHLIYNLDIDKAVSTFVDSFSMPEDLAIKVLHGRDLVIRMEDDSNIYVTEREESDEYPQINCKKIIKWFLEGLSEESTILLECIKKLKNSRFETEYSFEDLYNLIYSTKHTAEIADDLMERIKLKTSYYDEDNCDEYFSNFVQSVEYIKQWKETAYKKFKVIKFMIDNEWISTKDLNILICNELSMKDILSDYNEICSMYTDMVKEVSDDIVNEFNTFITSMNNIAEQVDAIQPITPDIKKDAYWLSPDGKLYGMNGHINSMVHLQIADALLKAGIVECEYHNLVDSYLEEQGWCKIHHNWILFEPHVYMRSVDMNVPIKRLTEKQVNVIVEYLKLHCNGFGKFGIKHHEISYITFKNMDDIKRTELFLYC